MQRCSCIAPEPLIENADTTDAIFRRVETKGQRSALLALIAAYVDGFREGEQFAAFASRIRQLLSRWKGRPIAPWPALDKSIGLFDPAKAPTSIAGAVLSGDRTPAEILGRLGLDTVIRQRGGLAEVRLLRATRIVASKRGLSVIRASRSGSWGDGSKDADGRLVASRGLFPTPSPLSFCLGPDVLTHPQTTARV